MQGRGRQAPTSTAALARLPGGRLDALRLSRRAKRGDRGAFEEIFRRHHQELYRYCLAIVGDRHDAEDALQATMAAALRSIPGEERDIDIRPWLFRVAHNESISMLRRRRATAEAGEDLVDGAGASQEAELATRERLRSLVADLGELPDRQRSAIVMRELTGLSYGEIGTALTCSEGAARQAVYEARTALREREEGRDMECEHVRRAISDRDGRRLRGRKIKAHLAGCDGCTGFAASIAQRRSDLRALFPPLPAAAAGAMLSGLVGGGSGAAVGGGAGAAAAGGGLAVSAAVKGGSLAAAIAIAAGAADVGGLIDLPNPIGGKAQPSAATGGAGSGAKAGSAPAVGDRGSAARATAARDSGSARGGGSGPGRGQGSGSGDGNAGQGGRGNGAAPTASANGGGNGGGSANAPGHTGSNPGGGSSTAPGQTGTAGNSGAAPGHTGTAGDSSSAPGQTGTAGNSAAAPGQTGSTPAHSGATGPRDSAGARGNSSK